MAPFRGINDAINTHPVELIVGGYMHLWTTVLLDACGLPQHVFAVALFLIVGSLLALLNHTRWQVHLPWMGYNNADHDTHHRLQKFNYGQARRGGVCPCWFFGGVFG